MTLAEATSEFIRFAGPEERPAGTPPESSPAAQPLARSLELVTAYFSPACGIEDITPERLRDFLARWYVEKAGSPSAPEPQVLIDSLADFFRWADDYAETRMARECMAVLSELRQEIPRAIEIAERLSKYVAGRGGAFGFPEFLTSFEEGGRGQFDLDRPGQAGAIEGYFRVIRVEGTSVEAEEIISEESVWPIIFPTGVADVIRVGFIINLELVRAPEGWQVAASGFAYPPGTEL
jgi:hypothetical protein